MSAESRMTVTTARTRLPRIAVAVATLLATAASSVAAQATRPQPPPAVTTAPPNLPGHSGAGEGSPPPSPDSNDSNRRERRTSPREGSNRDYRLVAGDKLRIEVYKDPQLSQSLQVRPDGKITMPLIGDIEAVGRTSLDLRDAITTSLREYMTNPVVTVIVVETQAPTAFVMGEVNHPGAIPIQGQLTVLQALALAGGIKDFADTKNIRVLRAGLAGMQTIAFNYKDALRGVGQPVFLRPGDTVVVPD